MRTSPSVALRLTSRYIEFRVACGLEHDEQRRDQRPRAELGFSSTTRNSPAHSLLPRRTSRPIPTRASVSVVDLALSPQTKKLALMPGHQGSTMQLATVLSQAVLVLLSATPVLGQQIEWQQSPINGHWYGAGYGFIDWNSGESLGLSFSGHLATVRSQAEQDWIASTFQPYLPMNGFWVGLRDVGSEGTWLWASGEPLTFTNWAPGEPNGFFVENWAHLLGTAVIPPGQWNWDDDTQAAGQTRALIESAIKPTTGWSWPQFIATPAHPAYGAAADLDGDGDVDYASPNRESNSVLIYLNNGSGIFTLAQTLVSPAGLPTTLVTFDRDSDGDQDLAVTCESGSLAVFENLGGAVFGSAVTVASGQPFAGVAAGDLNGDGVSDLAVTTIAPDNRLRLYFGVLGGGYSLGPVVPVGNRPYQVALARIDANASLDIVVASADSQAFFVLTNAGNGTFSAPTSYGAGGPCFGISIGDIDRDGDQDVMVPLLPSLNRVAVWKNDGLGVLLHVQDVVSVGVGWCDLADVDGDRDLDLVVASRGTTLAVHMNDGTGTFGPPAILYGQDNPVFVTCRDLNGDAKPDLITSNFDGNTLSVHLNQFRFDCNGNGIDDPLDIQSGAAVDCNGNGRPDSCDIAYGYSQDSDGDGIPNECDPPFVPFCTGDNADPIVTTGCPCSNFGALGHGCANSVESTGALLTASGFSNPDSVILHGSGMPTIALCIYLQGDGDNVTGTVFGDGIRCVDGNLIRLRTKLNNMGASQFPDPGDPSVSSRGMVVPGSSAVRYYQTYYRNSAGAFCPPETFNATNGAAITW